MDAANGQQLSQLASLGAARAKLVAKHLAAQQQRQQQGLSQPALTPRRDEQQREERAPTSASRFTRDARPVAPRNGVAPTRPLMTHRADALTILCGLWPHLTSLPDQTTPGP